MESELKGIKNLTASAPVTPLKPGDYDEMGNKRAIPDEFQLYMCFPAIEELSKPMLPDEYDRKVKELEAKYPGILS